ncbi:MAG: nuclease-related domain-containing protein [Pseudohongiellaceae bacterium]
METKNTKRARELLTEVLGIYSSGNFGRVGELLVEATAQLVLPCDDYHLMSNVILPAGEKKIEIDLLVLSQFGVFVIEVKTKLGLIGGKANTKTWSKVALNGTRSRFPNPCCQNKRQIGVIRKLLDIPANEIHPLVVFAGQVELKDGIPENVIYANDLVQRIKLSKQRVIKKKTIKDAVKTIEDTRL